MKRNKRTASFECPARSCLLQCWSPKCRTARQSVEVLEYSCGRVLRFEFWEFNRSTFLAAGTGFPVAPLDWQQPEGSEKSSNRRCSVEGLKIGHWRMQWERVVPEGTTAQISEVIESHCPNNPKHISMILNDCLDRFSGVTSAVDDEVFLDARSGSK